MTKPARTYADLRSEIHTLEDEVDRLRGLLNGAISPSALTEGRLDVAIDAYNQVTGRAAIKCGMVGPADYREAMRAALRSMPPPEPTEGQVAHLRERLEAIAGFGSVNLNGEYEHGLRDIIRSMTDCAREALRAMPLQERGWQDISTAPEGERVELFNELWDATFGEIQIGIFDDGRWSFDSGMDVYDIDDPIFDAEYAPENTKLTSKDFEPTHWRPLPRRPMVAEHATEAKS